METTAAQTENVWNHPDVLPKEPGEYIAALNPEEASPNVRRWWNGKRWSAPYMSHWADSAKHANRNKPSEFFVHWQNNQCNLAL